MQPLRPDGRATHLDMQECASVAGTHPKQAVPGKIDAPAMYPGRPDCETYVTTARQNAALEIDKRKLRAR